MFSLKSLFHKEEFKPIFTAGTWLKIKDECYQCASTYQRETPLFIKLRQGVYNNSCSCDVHTVGIASYGKFMASENGDRLTNFLIMRHYEVIPDVSTIELLECLLSNEIKKSADAREEAKNKRISNIQNKTAAAIKKTKCVEKS